MKKTLREIAELVGARLEGDGDIVISGLDNIEGAGPHDLTFAACPFDFMPPGGGDMYLFFPVKADPDK